MIDDKDLIYEGIATDQPIGDIWMIGRWDDKDLIYEGIATDYSSPKFVFA